MVIGLMLVMFNDEVVKELFVVFCEENLDGFLMVNLGVGVDFKKVC